MMECTKANTCLDFDPIVKQKANIKILKEAKDLNLKYPTEEQAKNASDKQIALWWLWHPTYNNRSKEQQKAMIMICSRFNNMPREQKDKYIGTIYVLDKKIIEASNFEEYKKYFYEVYPGH